MCPCVLICLPVQSVHPQLCIKGEGSAGKLQHQKQEQWQLSCGSEDKSTSATGA